MEVNSTQNTTATQSTSQVDNSEKNNSTQSTLFKTLQEKEINPRDITYEEYKQLTRDDINELFPIDTHKEQNDEEKCI